MEIGSAASIIARMKENYASIGATGDASAKERYSQQAETFTTYAEEHRGSAIALREIDCGPAVKFPLADFDPLSTGDGVSPGKALQAYAEGASIATKPKYGSLRLFRTGFMPSQHLLNQPGDAKDPTLSAAADGLSRALQQAKDQEAVQSDMRALFRERGFDENTLYQVKFDQREDGSIAASNHPLAAEVETLVNSNRELADMMSFLFAFNSQTNVTA